MSVPEQIYVVVAGDGRLVDSGTDRNQALIDAEDYANESGGIYEVHAYVPAARIEDPFLEFDETPIVRAEPSDA